MAAGTSEILQQQSTVDDLTKLIPAVIAADDADPELVAIGERYWALAGFAPDYGTPVWCEKTTDIDTAGWGQQLQTGAIAKKYTDLPLGHQHPALGRSPRHDRCPGPAAVRALHVTIADINHWPDPLHPDSMKISPLLGSLMRAGILQIHPSSKSPRSSGLRRTSRRRTAKPQETWMPFPHPSSPTVSIL
ncbi:hypothetical protein ACFWDI_32110 [Streptomyces sp. NPDC060064]|uniref:hypothetical protein n=1 Tax=Streptomyces sp. NPDC060064 TaxID=3347049 RepID=UPI0036888D44